MIQRIQSIYYLLAVATACLSLFLPIVSYVGEQGEIAGQLYGYGLQLADGSFMKTPWGIVIFAISCIVWQVVCFFSYKNRVRQIKLSSMVILLLLILVATIAVYAWAYTDNAQGKLTLGYGVPFPLLSVIFTWLARKNVKKDEDLVRAADRIR